MQPEAPTPTPRGPLPALIVLGVVAAFVVASTLNVAALAVGLLPVVLRADGVADSELPPTAGTIDWGPCHDDDLDDLGADCGFLRVPLDHRYPSGTPVYLAVSRIRHTAAHPQGAVIVNPGGPGASGLDTVSVAHDLPSAVSGRFDWIGFDPRGVGSSVPALHCDAKALKGPQPGYAPTSANVTAWTVHARSYARSCAGNGELLAHMTTVDSAYDVEALRIALHQDRIDYYGFSYGTWLGQVYATLFPDRVRRMVFDSTEDSAQVADQYGAAQAKGYDIAMRHYFTWVADWDTVYHLGSTARAVRHRWGDVRAALAAAPSGEVGGSEWQDLFLDAAYAQSDWPDLTDVFVEQVRHPDRHDLEDAYDWYARPDDNSTAAFLAVQCTDAPIDRSVPHLLESAARLRTSAPLTAWSNAWYGLPCAYWPAPSAKRPFAIDGSRVRSVLMIDQTLDAATPYSGSLAVRKRFPGARLIAQPGGTSHAQTPSEDSPCVTRWIVRYLATGALPSRKHGGGADVTCPAPPEPVPSS